MSSNGSPPDERLEGLSREHLLRLLEAVPAMTRASAEPDYERAFSYLSARVRSRALVILFSHVVDGTVGELLVRRVRGLRSTHLPLVVLFRDTDIEALAEPGSRPCVVDAKVTSAAGSWWLEEAFRGH